MIPGKFNGRLLPPLRVPDPSPAAIDPVLLAFDDGQHITMGDAANHTAAFGTTGSGKTSSVIIPMIKPLLENGLSGLILDIKGNFIDKVKALAHLCGRENDIIELGTGPEALPVNLLHNMPKHQVDELLKTLTLKGGMAHSHNISFYLSGVQAGNQLVALCRSLSRWDARLTPSLGLLGVLIEEFSLCSELLEIFKKAEKTIEEEGLLANIEQDPFHPCLWENAKSKDDRDLNTYLEQLNYRTKALSNALTAFRLTPGAERGFCSLGGVIMDLERWIYDEKKIVVIRFSPDSGATGEDLSRYALETFYKAVFTRGLELPEGTYTFIVADEFQQLINFNPYNRFNDIHFLSKSRELRNIFMVGTQSLSGLLVRGGDMPLVEAFISNINNTILLYTNDPWAQNLARRHDEVDLVWLKPAEAFFIKFNSTTRRHEHGLATLQKAHDLGRHWIREGKAKMAEARQDSTSDSEEKKGEIWTTGKVWEIIRDMKRTLPWAGNADVAARPTSPSLAAKRPNILPDSLNLSKSEIEERVSSILGREKRKAAEERLRKEKEATNDADSFLGLFSQEEGLKKKKPQRKNKREKTIITNFGNKITILETTTRQRRKYLRREKSGWNWQGENPASPVKRKRNRKP